jgi:acid phosphatase
MRFTGYVESMPSAGYTGCAAGGNFIVPLYARKHNPWADFPALSSGVNQPFTSFPADYTRLPAVAYVVPNQLDDIHSGSVAAGDTWLQAHLGSYAQWALAHDSLLIVTWDEDDGTAANHIPTIFAGAHVRPGAYPETITHYNVLRTIEALDGVSYTAQAASVTTIADCWQA